eukprot:3295343-Amphidinium_carterae.1
MGKEEQAVTALHLRAGLRGIAYESVRGLAHDELITRNAENKPTIDGVELLLRTLEAAIAKERPLRIQERFEKVFFSQTAYRSSGESMAAFIVRRKREMKELTDISPQTTVSADVQAQLLLRFSGLSASQRSQVIAAAGNHMDIDSVEKGLRAQFAEFHLRGGQGNPPASAYAASRPGKYPSAGKG